MPVDLARVANALDTVSLGKLQKQEQENGFKESSPHHKDKFFGKGYTGDWADLLTSAQIHRIEKLCGTIMKKHGYELSMRRAA